MESSEEKTLGSVSIQQIIAGVFLIKSHRDVPLQQRLTVVARQQIKAGKRVGSPAGMFLGVVCEVTLTGEAVARTLTHHIR
jgi:hypothetical protein